MHTVVKASKQILSSWITFTTCVSIVSTDAIAPLPEQNGKKINMDFTLQLGCCGCFRLVPYTASLSNVVIEVDKF